MLQIHQNLVKVLTVGGMYSNFARHVKSDKKHLADSIFNNLFVLGAVHVLCDQSMEEGYI